MDEAGINPLIREKIAKDIEDKDVRGFIEDVMIIEKESGSTLQKSKECENKLSKYVLYEKP